MLQTELTTIGSDVTSAVTPLAVPPMKNTARLPRVLLLVSSTGPSIVNEIAVQPGGATLLRSVK